MTQRFWAWALLLLIIGGLIFMVCMSYAMRNTGSIIAREYPPSPTLYMGDVRPYMLEAIKQAYSIMEEARKGNKGIRVDHVAVAIIATSLFEVKVKQLENISSGTRGSDKQ